MKKQDMREAMPETAAFIDKMRAAFGVESINESIKGGMRGQGAFWAKENGQEVGSRQPVPKSIVGWDKFGRSFTFDVPAGATHDDVQVMFAAEQKKANDLAMQRRGLPID
ncbi:hypothetical protein [Oxalicibacterium faecigallinarum]|uniref:Uncharacterized protein n=1 Tax=Oxalicibacterium faecigallinarum TaxID=573741 RepID=A0A8J3F470_9BURK|nr:hypothetical protein [Oxalicibacterium faecigallinarum]GGI16416.1 hypothetical protein GCM10008066_03850 [Oxalicibacterium faecigallinarum]